MSNADLNRFAVDAVAKIIYWDGRPIARLLDTDEYLSHTHLNNALQALVEPPTEIICPECAQEFELQTLAGANT
jgi:hypothetical protein